MLHRAFFRATGQAGKPDLLEGLVNVFVVVAVLLVVVLRLLGNQRVAGEQPGRDRGGVLQSRASHFGRVDDADVWLAMILISSSLARK